jgi:hypothetical protein
MYTWSSQEYKSPMPLVKTAGEVTARLNVCMRDHWPLSHFTSLDELEAMLQEDEVVDSAKLAVSFQNLDWLLYLNC